VFRLDHLPQDKSVRDFVWRRFATSERHTHICCVFRKKCLVLPSIFVCLVTQCKILRSYCRVDERLFFQPSFEQMAPSLSKSQSVGPPACGPMDAAFMDAFADPGCCPGTAGN
jgi:hypothetical protein